jgi:hypothetical protein
MKEEKYITIKTFNYPADSFLVKSKLESEGIECFLKDELTIQVDPLLSNAIGGVKLQVKENDYHDAEMILAEMGIELDDLFEKMPLYTELEKWTSNIKILKNLRFESRLIIITAVIILIAAIVVLLLPPIK